MGSSRIGKPIGLSAASLLHSYKVGGIETTSYSDNYIYVARCLWFYN